MKSSLKVFVDSDVVISSLISKKGAAHILLNTKSLKLFISNISYQELEIVVGRLNLNKRILRELIERRFVKIELKEPIEKIKSRFSKYTKDPNDAHITAGAVAVKARFLISYNVRDFNLDKIKKDFKIITLTPAQLLQYLRTVS